MAASLAVDQAARIMRATSAVINAANATGCETTMRPGSRLQTSNYTPVERRTGVSRAANEHVQSCQIRVIAYKII
jgi:hypothetical protein